MTQVANSDMIQESTCPAGGFPLLWTAFSLVPTALIEDENPDLWLNFLRDRVPHDQVISSIVFEEHKVVCLYESKGKQEHAIPYLISRACAREEANKVFAIREGDRLGIVCFRENKLLLGNIFEASTKEQALYWILKIYEQLELDKSTPIYIRCGDGTRKLLLAHLDAQQLD